MNWDQKMNVNEGGMRNKENYPRAPLEFGRNVSYQSNTGEENKEKIEKESKNQGKIMGFLDGLVKFSLVAVFFGLPLFFTNLTFQGIAFDKQIFFYFWVLLALVAWGIKSGYLGEMKIRRTSLDFPIIFFWLFYLVSIFFSIDRWHSFVGFFGDPSRGFISVTAIIILYYLVLSNLSKNLFKWLVRAVLSSGIIVLVWELIKVFDIRPFFPESFWDKIPINTIGSVQSSAIFVCFMALFLVMAVLKIQSQDDISSVKKNIYSSILVIFILMSLFLVLILFNYLPIFKSFPLVGLVIGSAFFLIFILAKVVKINNAWTFLPMFVFVSVLSFLVMGALNIPGVNLPFNVSIPYGTSLEIAKGSLADNFLIGYGPGNYNYAFSRFLPQNFDNMNLRFFGGEGIFFESISTIGAIGTSLLLILILTFLGTSIFLLYLEKEKNKIYSLGIFSATLVLLINAALSQLESSILLLLAMMGILTIGALFLESDLKEKFIAFTLKASPKFALTLAFISLLIFASVTFLFVFFAKIYVADIFMGKAVKSENISKEELISRIEKAINLNNKEGRYFTRLGQEYLVLTNEEMLKNEQERNVEKIRAYLSSGIQAGAKGKDLMKNDITATEALAQIYENSGIYLIEGLELAEKEYQKASELEPNNPNFYIRLGQVKNKMASAKEKIEEKKKLVEEAKGFFEKALEVRKNSDSAYYNLALAQEALGQQDEAIKNMTAAVNIQRNNINYIFNLARLYQVRGKGDDNKIAEELFKQILGVNDKEINTHFNLGLLYEKTDRRSEAVGEYNKVLELLPGGSETTMLQLEKMIDNIRKGVENTPETLGLIKNTSAENETVNSEESSEPENAAP